jgi:predicted dehydrogenase/threonine dehydrogenase-like Zn-dependent dehydrogenase
VKNLMRDPIPLGYSCAGDVIQVAPDVPEFRVGDRVACAGLGYANHAEVNYVPRNLAARIPDAVSYDSAAFVTVGAIAMHAVRLADVTLGERVVVLGLGLVGQVAAELARCAGATVIASDLDVPKLQLAKQLGAHHTVDGRVLAEAIADLTGGAGADAVLVCAATRSDEPLRQAAAVARLKGRIVVVGDVGMRIDRRALYEKELSLQVSRSYGPGRYDSAYEARGHDYPAAYVRWTEGRNMQAFVELVGRGDVALEPLVTHHFAIENANAAYEIVTGERAERAVAILLDYPDDGAPKARVSLASTAARRVPETMRVGVIGAGQFARGVLLPALSRQKGVHIHSVCTASGFTSRHVGTRYGAEYCTRDAAEIVSDPDVDAVLIATRHDQHAQLTAAALQSGKAVFVEKPLALDEASLGDVASAARVSGNDRLMVGFNRRFAPLAVACREFFDDVTEPLFVSCRVNAGALPDGSWAADPVEGGGRIVGEVCHFVDTVCFLAGSLPTRVYAEELATNRRQDLTVTLRLANGSVAVIHYLANGDPGLPKEFIEVFGAGRVAQLDNFRRLTLYRNNRRDRRRLFNQAKGHAEEVARFVQAVLAGGPMPVPIETALAVTRTCFLVHESLALGAPVPQSPDRGIAAEAAAPRSRAIGAAPDGCAS